MNEAPRFTTVLHVNARSEFEQTELQICAENQRTDVIVTAPLAIHNTVCNKNLETICAKCHALAQKQSRLKKYATGFVMFASLAFCAVMAATVLPASTKQQYESQIQDNCYNDGNKHSVGSVEKMDDGQYKECVAVPNHAPQWRALNRYKFH
ncbi:hypothetical protein H8L47_28745 [Undibacterium sp. NL8W]|uniref:Uncharacterized protein n=1 Tax=Undibacterium umbellatum TaxID=2762300 RepID=A0ABR6ZIN6_9BURK|nr:hypothetical protein [Undibacterium umbellatum]